jgi:hypothetical protein
MNNLVGLDVTSLVINDVLITGFSEDSDAITIPKIERAVVKYGGDGRMVAMTTGKRGGVVTIKLLASSPSVPFMNDLSLTAQAGAGISVYGLLRSNTQLSSCAFQRGYFTSDTPYASMGASSVSSYEYEIGFEVIAADFSSAVRTQN